MTLTSRFTNAGLDLLADWAAHPEHARPFSIMKLGTLNDAEYETKEYDGSETDITHTGSDNPVAELDVTTVKVTPAGGSSGSAVAKVTGALRPNVTGEGRELRGHHIREIGLFIDGASVPDPMILVWIGTFPDQYIPTEEESSIDVQMSITVPVKFDNAAAVQVVTDNTLVEQRVATLENDVQTMNGGAATVTPKASQADMEKAAKCINKLNASGIPGTALPDIDQVKLKADKDIVGEVPTYPNSYGTPTRVSPSNVWNFVKQMNNGAGTAGDAKQKADQTDFETLQKYARKMNTGSETSTAAAKQKVDQTAFDVYKLHVAGLTASIVSSNTHPAIPASVTKIRVYADFTIPRASASWKHVVSAAPVDVSTNDPSYIGLALLLGGSWKCVFSSDTVLSAESNDVLDLRFFEYMPSTTSPVIPTVITTAHMQIYRYGSIDGSIGCCSGESTRSDGVRMRCLLWQPFTSLGTITPVVFSVFVGEESPAPFIRGFAVRVPNN